MSRMLFSVTPPILLSHCLQSSHALKNSPRRWTECTLQPKTSSLTRTALRTKNCYLSESQQGQKWRFVKFIRSRSLSLRRAKLLPPLEVLDYFLTASAKCYNVFLSAAPTALSRTSARPLLPRRRFIPLRRRSSRPPNLSQASSNRASESGTSSAQS